jgi:hypothetical protein
MGLGPVRGPERVRAWRWTYRACADLAWEQPPRAPGFPNDAAGLRHQRPLLSIEDALLGTEMEHACGWSMSLPDDDIARGRHAGGKLVWHSSV